MDDIIQILVFLFIIYLIFGSAFKKKKTEQKRFPQSGEGEDYQQSSPKPKYETSDILQDLFGVKIPKTGDEYPPIPKDLQIEAQETSPTNLRKEVSYTFNSPTLKTQIPNIDFDKMSTQEIEKTKSILDEAPLHYSTIEQENEKLIEIKERIYSPSNLRDLVLISEIIGKPKALRR